MKYKKCDKEFVFIKMNAGSAQGILGPKAIIFSEASLRNNNSYFK